MLQERIHINHVIRDRLKNSIEQLKSKILESITSGESHLVEKIHENLYKKSFELTKKRHIRKFNELVSKNEVTESATNITDKKKWVINMSSRLLTHIETDLLAKGLNFSITSKTLPNKDIIATVEDAVKDLEKEEADTIRAKLSLTLQNSKRPKNNLSKDERKALKELQSHTSIVILPADKGSSTVIVILNREDYLEKCMDHINNGPYQLLKKDPTTKIKTKTLKQLKVLNDNEFTDNKLYYYLKPTDSPAPRFYGQPKIHKPGVPIRPTVSYSGFPKYNLNKYIANILKAYVKDENNNAKNFTSFSNYIRNAPVEDDEIMVSFHVTSLYTNIPIIDTLNIIKDYVNNDDQFTRKTAIHQDKFLDLVHLVLTTTWYTFNSQFYQKTDGVAMGGPASSATAEIYMQAYECTAITTALHPTTALYPPKVWERFVDDVYSILKRTHLENFFHHINNLHQNIRFTMEEESNGELAFLDTLLKRNNGEISVLVYKKPTRTDQYLHYSSHHQTSCKESGFSSLFNRAHSIITNKDDLHKENARIKQVLKENGYRESIINKIFRRITNNHSLPQSQQLTQATDIQEEEIRISINLACVEGMINYVVYSDLIK